MTDYLCPSCHNPLHQACHTKDGRIYFAVWCGKSSKICASIVSNDGAEGTTLDEAFRNLEDLIEREEIRKEFK